MILIPDADERRATEKHFFKHTGPNSHADGEQPEKTREALRPPPGGRSLRNLIMEM